MRAANYIKAIGEGRSSNYLLDALEKLEAEKQAVCAQMEVIDDEIEMATVKRLTAVQIQEVWAEALDVWEDVTEDERQEIMAAFVTRVDVKEKDRTSMELQAIPTGYGQKFVTKSQMGAGRSLNANPTMVFPLIRSSLVHLAPHAKRVIRQAKAA